MLRLSRWFGVLAVLLCASVASAQRPGGPGGGGRGFGGGFGGGPGGPGGGMSPLMLIGNEAVQKELGLNDDQTGKLKKISEDSREDGRAAFSGFNFQEIQALPEAERTKKMEEMRAKMAENAKKVNEKYQPKVDEVLDATQRERLQQIAVQAGGTRVLQESKISESLKLSKEQLEKLTTISKEFDEKQREMFRGAFGGGGGAGGGGDFQERMEKMREMNDARDKQSLDVLSADQKDQFAKLKGKPFDVAQLRPRGFGPGGPGGGGPNPGGRPQRRPQSGDKKSDEKKSDN